MIERWSYDGSLEGLLALAQRAFSEGRAPSLVSNGAAAEPDLFSSCPEAGDSCDAASSPQHATPRGLLRGGSQLARPELRTRARPLFDLAVGVWMSDEALEEPLLWLIARAATEGPGIAFDFTRPDTRALRAACERVRREIHRLQGFARFSPRRDGLYSALLCPDHRVLSALMPHFLRRFDGQPFALIDMPRRIALISRDGTIESADDEAALAFLPDTADEEKLDLWRGYFSAAGNPERANPNAQRRFIPRRYWKFIPELDHIGSS